MPGSWYWRVWIIRAGNHWLFITWIHYNYKSRVPHGCLECYKSGADHVDVNASASRANVLENSSDANIPEGGNMRSNYMQALLRQIYIIYPFNINTVSYI